MKKISKEAEELITEYGLSVEDFTAAELKKIERQVECDRKGMLRLDGVEWSLFPKVLERKLDKEFKENR